MVKIASLPMYDLPEVRAQTDALWTHLARAMRRAGVKGVPDSLDREHRCDVLWGRSDLLFSQTCGYPMMREYRTVLRPVGTPRYSVPSCQGSKYASVVLVRADSEYKTLAELRGTVCAVNSPGSQSGYNALRAMVAPLAENGRFFSEVRMTGSHLGSIESVAAGEADVCAVDCVTHALLSRYHPSAVAGTRAMSCTPSCPGLPFVTRADLEPDQFRRLRAAVNEALSDPKALPMLDALFIEGVDELELDDYEIVLKMESEAAAAGYGVIR